MSLRLDQAQFDVGAVWLATDIPKESSVGFRYISPVPRLKAALSFPIFADSEITLRKIGPLSLLLRFYRI
jgi:hypothetical protein